jgi:hypothetical protein
MNSEQMERLNELSQVAMDGELRFGQLWKSIKEGNLIISKMHLEQAHRVCHRIENELLGETK